ncbi:MAG: hypothetical protein ACRDTD_23790, partial [Pseudonocardiaceae bacterium]
MTLVVLDGLARLILRGFASHDETDVVFGLCVYGVLLFTMVGFGFWWALGYVLQTVWGYLAVAAAPAAALIGVFGPWVSGEALGDVSFKIAVLRVLLTYGVMAAGAVVG